MSISCAKRGSITGGKKDTLAPILVKSIPVNQTTNFKGKKIKILFNELITVKDIGKQLIISPPMEKKPNVSPQGLASKSIEIELKEEPKPNTTYSFNFGQSIADFNEGIPFNQFKYVFSTGNTIDSLKTNGSIKDAFENKDDDFITVLLYEASKNKDSLVYKETPYYATNTLEKNASFEFENLKEGDYYIYALKDLDNNYKFNPKSEKIAFLNDPISIPKDKNLILKLFKEEQTFRTEKPFQESTNKMYLPYAGKPKDLKVKAYKNNVEVPLRINKINSTKPQDSLEVFLPKDTKDSLRFVVEDQDYKKEYKLKINKLKSLDTLSVVQKVRQGNSFYEKFGLIVSTPILSIDQTKISLKKGVTKTNKNGTIVPYKIVEDQFNKEVLFDFNEEEDTNYQIKLQKGAFEDIYGKKSDTLTYNFKKGKLEDFGNLRLTIKNTKRLPIVVELINSSNTVVQSMYGEKEGLFDFIGIQPSLYTIRLFYDDNKNKVWNSGNVLKKIQPEEMYYYPTKIDVRANWDVDQTIDLNAKNAKKKIL